MSRVERSIQVLENRMRYYLSPTTTLPIWDFQKEAATLQKCDEGSEVHVVELG